MATYSFAANLAVVRTEPSMMDALLNMKVCIRGHNRPYFPSPSATFTPRFFSASRSRYSISALTLRSSCDARRSTAAWSAGSSLSGKLSCRAMACRPFFAGLRAYW